MKLFVIGKNGRVKVFDRENRQLTVQTDGQNNERLFRLEFVPLTADNTSGSETVIDEFEIVMSFGEDIKFAHSIRVNSGQVKDLTFEVNV